MRVLVMTFLTSGGQKATIRVRDVKDTLDPVDVSAAMDAIIDNNIFFTSSGELKIKDSAQVVITTNEVVNI
ncbi:MAG: DUF2922 domain-containing protein [Clostridiaceae bacterium]